MLGNMATAIQTPEVVTQVKPPVPMQVPRKFAELFSYPFAFRNFVARGGRGGGKSHTIAMALVTLASHHKLRILCAREFQNSISESVHQLLKDKIEQLGLQSAFIITDKTIYCPATGSDFIFAGIRTNINKIKSLEGVDICWVEEAAKVSKDSLDTLLPTIRKAGSIMVFSYNPDLETDPVDVMFNEKNMPPDTIVVEIPWYENKFFTPALRQLLKHAYKVDPEGAAHIWGGGYRRNSDAQIFRGKYIIEPFAPVTDAIFEADRWSGPYYGLDFGFSSDPTAAVKCWIFQKKLYIEYAEGDTGIEIDHLPTLLKSIPGGETHLWIGDSASPQNISYLSNHGIRCEGAVKGQGSIEFGIDFIKNFEVVVIHPRCSKIEEEFRMYSYKTDKLSRIVLPDVLDAWNHWIDALRYALEKAGSRKLTMYDVL